MKVLLLNGSPNKNGCTYTALQEVAAALHEEGIETQTVQIGTEPIRGCIGCGQCAKLNRCAFEDDILNDVLALAKEADGFVFGTPVYFASPNGALISLMDRLFMTCDFKGKPAAAIASGRRSGASASQNVLNKYFEIAGMPIATSNYYGVTYGHIPAETREDLEGLQTMRILGRNMAWLLKSIQAADAAGVARPLGEKKIKTSHTH